MFKFRGQKAHHDGYILYFNYVSNYVVGWQGRSFFSRFVAIFGIQFLGELSKSVFGYFLD